MHTHIHTQKSFKILSLFLHPEEESVNANNPRLCPSVAVGMEKQGCLAKGVDAEANHTPPALSQMSCTSRLLMGYCHLLLLSPCPE